MCLAVYIASSLNLPLVVWNENEPAFYVSDLTNDKDVRNQFTLPNVRYVGSCEGCGCGFLKDGEYDDGLAKVNEDYARLAAYIVALQEEGSDIELFSCWEGDQTAARVFDEKIRADDLTKEGFEFKEKALYRLER